MEFGRRLLEHVYPRRVKQRLLFDGGQKASLEGFEAMWKTDAAIDLTQASLPFATDGFIRQEYTEIFDLIIESFGANVQDRKPFGTALVRGSSGVGKSAFLQYLVARIRHEVKSILVVRRDASGERTLFLYLSTNIVGWKTAIMIDTFQEAKRIEQYCEWTIVDGSDWEPNPNNCTVGAASPSTSWKGFRLQNDLLQICMPPWSLDELEACRLLTRRRRQIDAITLQTNYQLVGGIARWALDTTAMALNQVASAVNGVDFSVVQSVMATQHATKNDEKELVHRLVLWTVGKDENVRWLFEITSENAINYAMLTDFVAKKLSEKAAMLSIEKRRTLISELKGDGAASAYRGVIFEADAIDRLVRGGTFMLHKCSSPNDPPIELSLGNTGARFPMQDLDSLNVHDASGQVVVPDARNFESADAFKFSLTPPKSEAFLFQMTVENFHPTKYNGVKVIMDKIRNELGSNHAMSCKLVFVVPSDVKNFFRSPQAVINMDGTVRRRQERDLNKDNQYFVAIEYE